MREIVAMFPMAGSGSRLGMPFPKPLAPTFTKTGIKPLYWHALQQLDVAGITNVFGIVSADDLHQWHKFDAFPLLPKPTRGNAIDTVKWGAEWAKGADILICLPDVILYDSTTPYQQRREYKTLVDWHRDKHEGRLSVGLAYGPNVLDGLYDEEDGSHIFKDKPAIEYEEASLLGSHTGLGWAALLGPSEIFAGWDKSKSWAESINDSDWLPVTLGATAIDLGTPERYMRYMDRRVI